MTALAPEVPRGAARVISIARSAIGSVRAALRPRTSRPSASDKTEPPGWIDGIVLNDDGIFRIHGWALPLEGAPARVFFTYDGIPYGSALADTYRPDLDAAIAGSQCVGFDIPVPDDPERFDPGLFEAYHQNGAALARSN